MNRPHKPNELLHGSAAALPTTGVGKASMKHRTEKSIPAPEWLTKRMETLQRMPPPTLREVDTHFKASAEIRKRLNAK
jgi:hypothetical protein